MAIVAGEVFVGRVDVEEDVTFGTEVFELNAAALGENGVPGVAVTCRGGPSECHSDG